MSENQRKQPKLVIGEVVSTKMDKTIAVQVGRLVKHPIYAKYVKHFTKYYAHDEKSVARRGDRVELVSTRPLSKLKRWCLVRVVSSKGGEE